VQKEISGHFADSNLAVLIVWVPMVPTDSERAARREARLLDDPRVHHFYDPQKALGRAFATDVFVGCIDQALQTLPAADRLRERLEAWSQLPPHERIVWDAFFVYPKEVVWEDCVPVPSRWAKQVEFRQVEPLERSTGTFWMDDCAKPPHKSDWFTIVRTLTDESLSGS